MHSHRRWPDGNEFYPLLPNSWTVVQSPSRIPPTQGSDEHVQAWVLSNRVDFGNDQR